MPGLAKPHKCIDRIFFRLEMLGFNHSEDWFPGLRPYAFAGTHLFELHNTQPLHPMVHKPRGVNLRLKPILPCFRVLHFVFKNYHLIKKGGPALFSGASHIFHHFNTPLYTDALTPTSIPICLFARLTSPESTGVQSGDHFHPCSFRGQSSQPLVLYARLLRLLPG